MFKFFPLLPLFLILISPYIFSRVGISLIMFLLINIISFCIFLYSTWYMKDDKRRTLFMIYLSGFTLFMNLLTVAKDYITFFIGWEGVGLTSFLLIGFWFEDKENVRKAKQAFLLTKLTDIGYIVGAAYLMYNNINFMNIDEKSLTQMPDENFEIGFKEVPPIIRFLMFTPCIGKSALFPLLVWLPNAMVAPTPVSAHLHSATMVAAGVFYITKFSNFFGNILPVSLITGKTYFAFLIPSLYLFLIGFLLSAILAFFQPDIKKLLAYSTINNLSLMYLGYFITTPQSLPITGSAHSSGYLVSFLHLILHALSKASLFLISGILIHTFHTQELQKLKGSLSQNTILKFLFIFFILSLSGLPPFGSFWSKSLILHHIEDYHPFKILSYIMAILSSLYCARIFTILIKKDTTQNQNVEIHLPKIPIISLCILFAILVSLSILFTLQYVIKKPIIFPSYPFRHFIFHPGLYLNFKMIANEAILVILSFSFIYLFFEKIEKLISLLTKAFEQVSLEKIYFYTFQVPVQFIHFFVRKSVEIAFDTLLNSLLTSELVKFLYNLYSSLYNGLLTNYLIILIISLAAFIAILLGYAIF
jgi:NADH-quinone oxidoreductase subunit L